jgi:hypothetical protein
LLVEGRPNHIDPDKWRPLIMSFQKFYGLAPGQLLESRLGQIPEKAYRSPDVDRGRSTARIVASASRTEMGFQPCGDRKAAAVKSVNMTAFRNMR